MPKSAKGDLEQLAALRVQLHVVAGQPLEFPEAAFRLDLESRAGDEAEIELAWNKRRRARTRAEVLVPSSVVHNDPPLDSDLVLYVEGHEIEAGRARGRMHGFEFVRQCHEELVKAGVAMGEIGPTIVVPGLSHVAEWVARDIDSERIDCPTAAPQ